MWEVGSADTIYNHKCSGNDIQEVAQCVGFDRYVCIDNMSKSSTRKMNIGIGESIVLLTTIT